MKPNGDSPVSDKDSSSIRWAPILGHWSVGEDAIAYKGGEERSVAHGQDFPMGILANNRDLLSGACRVEVEFEDVSSGAFVGGIILGYRSQESIICRFSLAPLELHIPSASSSAALAGSRLSWQVRAMCSKPVENTHWTFRSKGRSYESAWTMSRCWKS